MYAQNCTQMNLDFSKLHKVSPTPLGNHLVCQEMQIIKVMKCRLDHILFKETKTVNKNLSLKITRKQRLTLDRVSNT